LAVGNLASTVLVKQGGNMVAWQGINEAVRSARDTQGGKAVFGIISGNDIKHNTGSNIDMQNFSLMTGGTASNNMAAGAFDLGAFIEYGDGHYGTYNSFANAASVKGSGKTHYWGGGLLSRFDFNASDSGNFYLENSLRAGRVKNHYKSGLQDFAGRYAHFKTSANYASLHLGGGYRFKMNDSANVNLYGMYFHTRVGSDNVRLSTGDPVKFKAVTSNRVRVGGRYEWTLDNITPFAGLAYEHEFNGKARASANGYEIERPSLQGDIGIVEGGLIIKPAPKQPLSINVGLQGYFGKQEGIGGNVRLKYEF
jgi:outer membrane autotransporter protein